APGNYVDFQLRVNNTSDVGANVQITIVGISDTGDTTATLPAGVDTIYANSHASVLFTVRITAGSNAESKNAIYKVIVTLVGVPQPVSSYVNLTAIVQRLYDIDASCAQPQQYAGLGDVIYYTVSVQNKGNVNDTNVVVSIKNDPASWASIEGPSIFSLAPNEVRNVNVRVSVPSNWQNSVNYQFIVNVNASGNRNDMVTLTTIVSFSSKLTSAKNSTSLNPGASERLNFTVTNLGTGNDTILLKAQASTDILTWITLDTSSVTLAKGESANVYFTLSIPQGQPEGKYYFKIIATSLWDSSRTSTQDYSVTVKKVTLIELSSAVLAKESLPGTDVTYTFTVQNTGNGVSIVSPMTGIAPEGWSATLSTSAFTINPGEQKTVTLTVTIPQNEVVCTKTITVTAIADAGANQNAKSITFTANIKQSSKISVAISEPSLTIEPGSNGANTLTIRNNGNGPESVNVTVSMAKDWLIRDFETSFNIPLGESRTIELKFEVPSDLTEARAGEYLVNITVKYANGEKSVSIGCKIVVPAVYRLVLSADSYSKTQNVDDRTDVQYTIYVTNMGNDRDLVTMQADMPSGLSTYSFIPNQQAIEPLQTIEVVLKIPYSAISSMLVSDQPHPITVSAKSIDQKLSNSLRFNLSVKSAELSVLSSQITYSKNTILKDGTVTVTAEIRNDGGAPAKNVVVRFYDVYESDGTWNENLIGSTTIPSIGVNSVQTTSIEWTVTEIGSHKVKVKLEGAETVSTSILTVKEPEKGIFDQLSSPALMIGLVIGLGIGMILLIGSRGGAKTKVETTHETKPEVSHSERKAEGPSVKEEVAEKTKSDETETETIKVGKEETKEETQHTKIARVKCPKCGEIKDVTSPVRPIEVKCDKCGTKMRLKH
ncbi:MAG: NEW3 domain-containing protein, partial [Thermoplasmata archaeon]